MITAEHEKRIREHYTNLKAHPELIDLIIKRTNEEINTPSENRVDMFSLFVFSNTPEGNTYWQRINQDVKKYRPSTPLRSNYFEMVQAVKPELKVFKYSTRVYKCSADYLTLWSSSQPTSQKECEQSPLFIKWVGDTVEHTVEYEE
jgi:hypothetical protein